MSKIIDLIKQTDRVRVSFGFRWLVFNQYSKQFEVYEKKPRDRTSTIAMITTNEDEAVSALECEE